ncbi:MAG: DUF2723 domain-containing protein [bacterium]|nr:DUF2723 domain-containing protein [bacterium]
MIRRFGSSPRTHAALVALVAFVVYFVTRVPGLYYTDSGELAAACSTLGIAHPTGYPLFTIIGHVWLMLPWTSAIVGLNVLAAVWTAAAVGMIVLLVWELLHLIPVAPSRKTPTTDNALAKLLLAGACALMFAFSATVWAQGTAIEVYSLQLLLTTLALWCVLKSVREQENVVRWTALASLCTGLMLANHLSSVFLAPGLAAVWYAGVRGKRSVASLLPWLVVPALLAVALYAYMPLRSAQLPVINWGMVHRGWEAFMYHAKGTQFSVWMFSDAEGSKANLGLAFKLLAFSVLFAGVIPVVIGLVSTLKRNRGVGIGLLLVLLGNVIISVGYNIPDIDNYFIPMLLVAALWFAVGLHTMFGTFRMRSAFASALFVLPVIALIIGWPAQNRSTHVAVDAYTRWTLANAEPRAIILSRQWDYFCSALWYMQTVEHYRTDVVMIEKELMRRTWYVPYLQYRYPEVMKPVQAEADAYMQLLVQFERDADEFKSNSVLVRQIQQRFVDLLVAILKKNSDRPLYLTFEIMDDEPELLRQFEVLPVGPLIKIAVGGGKGQRVSFNYTDSLIQGLRGRSERLDDGLRKTVRGVLETNTRYANTVGDSAGMSHFRRLDAQLIQRRR